ncbi:DUF397 domain-containing protein [Streptomyces sp. NPDC002758]
MQGKDPVFYKSSYSNGAGECVEVAESIDGSRYVRDSKDTTGPMLHFTPDGWTSFVLGVKDNEFDN